MELRGVSITNTNIIAGGGTPSVVTTDLEVQLLPSSYPGTGTTWNDTEGQANATLTGTPTYNVNTGFTFNGTTQYGRLPNSSGVTDFTNTSAYTVEVWFNPDSGQPSNTLATVLEKWNSTSQSRYPYVVRYNESATTLGFSAYDGTNNPGAFIAGYTTGIWHQAVGVYNFPSGTITPYRNGTAGTPASLSGVGQVSNTSQVGIAHRIGTTGLAQFLLKGSVGIVRIYSRALTGSEILQNFNANKTIFGL